MWKLLQIETYKIFRKPRTYLAFAIIAAFIFLIQIGLFLSPVVYPISSIPDQWRELYSVLNPVATAIDDLRLIMLHGEWPTWDTSALAFAWSLFLLVVAYAMFKRLERGFADRV